MSTRVSEGMYEGHIKTKEEEEHLDVCKECMKAYVGLYEHLLEAGGD